MAALNVAMQAVPLRIGRASTGPGAAAGAMPDPLADARARSVAEGQAEGQARGYRDGLAQGRQDGLAQGREQARKELEGEQQALRRRAGEHEAALVAVLQSLQSRRAEWLSAERDALLALACGVLGQLVGETMASPPALRARIERLLARTDLPPATQVRLHPADLQRLLACGPITGPELVADERLPPGSCEIHAPGGGLDAGLDAVLQDCKAAFLAACEPVTDGEAS